MSLVINWRRMTGHWCVGYVAGPLWCAQSRAAADRACCAAQVFACTVGQKPSKAPFYVNDTAEVLSILGRLLPPSPASPRA